MILCKWFVTNSNSICYEIAKHLCYAASHSDYRTRLARSREIMNDIEQIVAVPAPSAEMYRFDLPSASEAYRNRAGRLYPGLRATELVTRLFPPFVANRLRMALLRAAGLNIGHGSIFWGPPTIVGSGDLRKNLSIGVECGFNVGSFFELDAPIRIGNRVQVGHDVMILTASYTVGEGKQRAGEPISAPVTIEDGVWLGARCVIMPGVTVGAGSVIGAMAFVDKDVPPNTLVMGSQKISLARWR